MRIEAKTRTVYLAPTRGRHYLTKRAAANNEATALILRKYPTEREERDDSGRITYDGWHWTSDKRLVALHSRIVRRIMLTTHKGQTQ